MGRNRKTIQDFLAESEPADDQDWQQQEQDEQQQWEEEQPDADFQ